MYLILFQLSRSLLWRRPTQTNGAVHCLVYLCAFFILRCRMIFQDQSKASERLYAAGTGNKFKTLSVDSKSKSWGPVVLLFAFLFTKVQNAPPSCKGEADPKSSSSGKAAKSPVKLAHTTEVLLEPSKEVDAHHRQPC